MGKIEQKMQELGLTLPDPIKPVGTYCPFKQVGNVIFFSGQGPLWNGEFFYNGKVGRDITKEEGYQAARMTGLNVIAQIKAAIGDLDRVKQFVNVLGYVNCVDEFTEQPYVINGFSDLIKEIFGEKGNHARCAVPSGTLPMNTSVEIHAVIEVEEQSTAEV
ncbi:MAG: RidA family protein [Lachnospiraceae bacterium]